MSGSFRVSSQPGDLSRTGSRRQEALRRHRGDLSDPGTLEPAVRGASTIIHLAAVFGTSDSDLIWKSNLEKARNLIAATRMHAPDTRFIMASTARVYSKHGAHPGRETDAVEPDLASPTSIYELVRLVGGTMPDSAEPTPDPWYLQIDPSLSRQPGFQPSIRSVHQAVHEQLL